MKYTIIPSYTFLDYIFAGCDVSLIVGIDFTLTNKSPTDPDSLHFIPTKKKKKKEEEKY